MQHVSSPKQTRSAAVLLLMLLLLLAGPGARAQAPAWQSAMAFTQPAGSTSQVTGTVTDVNGNVYLAGFFVGNITFGSTTLTSAGGSDIFIAKWNPVTTTFSWAQRGGGAADDRATALASNGSSLFLTGYFTSATASFGGTTLTNTASGPGTDFDVFITKITDAGSSGSFVWATRAGSAGIARAYALATSGNAVYVGGSFSGTAAFDSFSITTNGGTEAFVAKLLDSGAAGTFAWAKQARSTGSTMDVNALAVSGASVYAVGSFLGSTATLGTVTLSNSSSNFDGFVTKLTDAGTSADFVWAQRAGGIDTDDVQGLAVRGSALYISGNFLGTASFGSLTLSSAGLYDLFVAKLTDAGSTGSFVWAKRAGGPENDYAPALAVNGSSLCVAGAFKGSADFGSTTLTSAGDYDVFATKIVDAGSSGSFAWAQRAGGAGVDAAATVALDRTTVYVAGSLTPPASFGPFVVTGQPNTRIGFLASLTDPVLTATTAARSDFSFSLTPNPAHGTASLTLPTVPGAASATLTLLDALGRAVRTRPATPGARTEFNLSGLAPGLYALRATAGAATATQRLVVE